MFRETWEHADMARSHPSQPPRLAKWLLALMLDEGDREYVLGDLASEYRSICQTEGTRAAWVRLSRAKDPCAETENKSIEHLGDRFPELNVSITPPEPEVQSATVE